VKPLRLIAGCTVLIALALLAASAQKPPAAVMAALQTPDPTQFRIEGELKSKSPTLWVVGEYNLLVDGQTQIIEKHGSAEVGAWLIIWAVGNPSGAARADVIVVDRPGSTSSPIVQFTDLLNKISGEWWVVGQELVHVGPGIAPSPLPPLGSLVSVTAEQKDMVLEAIRIQVPVTDPSQIPNDFEGTIEEIEPDRWKVDGRWVKVSGGTEIDGLPAVGKHAEIRALIEGDQSLLAVRIRIPEKLEVSIGALVNDISAQASGAGAWEVSVFPDQQYSDPYSATVHLDGYTLVEESRAVAMPGQWADLRAELVSPGEFQAQVIRLEETVPITETGSLQQAATASGAGGWARIGGRTVWFPGQMARGVSAATGGQGEVLIEGLLLGNGVIWAQRVVPIESP
jgi:hypothetical protein